MNNRIGKKVKMFISLIVGLLLCSHMVYGQLNLVAGYTGGYFQTDKYNETVDSYNMNLDSTQRTYKGINVFNGASIGFNYRIERISLEALWTERFKFDRERRIDPISGDLKRTNLNTNYRSLSFGLNLHFDKVLLGASINSDYLLQRIRPAQGVSVSFTKEQVWSSRFHIGFYGKINNQSAVSLQPFVHIPWSEINIASLDRQLNKSTASDIQEDFMHFGISLFLYNGPQIR